jgi:hypothetical protein
VTPADFDLHDLHAALDARRATLGLTWAALAAEFGVSAGTLRGLGERRSAEGDGVLRAIAWLGRTPESFVPGAGGGTPLPTPAAALRFDAGSLYAALEAARAGRGLTWTAVAADCGAGSPFALTRLRDGGRVRFPEVMRVLAWLGAPAARFVRVG